MFKEYQMKKLLYRTAVVLTAALMALASIGCTKSTSAASAPTRTPQAAAPASAPPAQAQTSAPASSGTNWDSLLDQYEKFVDDYIAAMEKAAAGDFSAMTTAASLMEQAESLSTRLADASDEISAAQSARLLRIQTKLANAAASAF
jgi:hypothetical protein